MSSPACSLCLVESLAPPKESRSTRLKLEVKLITQKLFGTSLDTSQISAICNDCVKAIIDCYEFYEKVCKAQGNWFKSENDLPIAVENIKTEEGIIKVEVTENDESNFDLKDEYLNDGFSDEDDIALHQFVSKVHERKKHKTKVKKYSKVKKSNSKKKESKENKDSNNTNDPEILIDSNGIFIVKGQKLQKIISKFYILTCDVCEKKHESLRDLFKHYEKQHGKKGYVTCCDQRMEIYKKIKFHMAMHVQPSAFNCDICKKSVTRPSALKYHLLTHLPMGQKPLQCEQCGRGFVHRYHLQQHMNLHLPMEKRPFFQCKFCDKTFTVKKTYAAHVSVKHTKPKNLCTHCGKSFRDKQYFNYHMKMHEPDSVTDSKRVKCPVCNVILAHEIGLQVHMKRHDSNFPCPHCDYFTRSKVELNKHIQVKHTDLKPHVCVVCNKAFKLKSSMKIHMAQHTGERKHACPFCPRTFMDPSNCYSHKKKMHPVELKRESEIRKLYPRSISLQSIKENVKKNDSVDTVDI